MRFHISSFLEPVIIGSMIKKRPRISPTFEQINDGWAWFTGSSDCVQISLIKYFMSGRDAIYYQRSYYANWLKPVNQINECQFI